MATSGSDESRHLLDLSHDELGVIVDGLANPLQPVVAVAFSTTCKGLLTPLRAAREMLQQQHEKAAALCRKITPFWKPPNSCAQVRDAKVLSLDFRQTVFTTDDMATLGMILRTNGMQMLQDLDFWNAGCDTGQGLLLALCEELGPGAAPSLRNLWICFSLGLADAADAIAAALSRGAMPGLEELDLFASSLGNRGLAALAKPLRKLPALKKLMLGRCKLGDEGVASLMANLGKDDFKELNELWLGADEAALDDNKLTDKSCDTLISALDDGAMPKLKRVVLTDYLANDGRLVLDAGMSREAWAAYREAAERRGITICGEDYYIDEHGHCNIGEGATEIPARAFLGGDALVSISLPSTLRTIGEGAFANCVSLLLTELPAGVTSIGEYAFFNCVRLALTELPAEIESIGKYAFCYCKRLALRGLPDGINSIDEGTFEDCSMLALTKLPASLRSIGTNAFCRSGIYGLWELPDGIESIGVGAFHGCLSLLLMSVLGYRWLPSGIAKQGPVPRPPLYGHRYEY